MPTYTQREIREFEQMKKAQEEKDNPTQLENPVDIVIIDRETRKVESITVWVDIRNVARIGRLIERETKGGWGVESEAVAVAHRSVGRGEILQDNQIINI